MENAYKVQHDGLCRCLEVIAENPKDLKHLKAGRFKDALIQVLAAFGCQVPEEDK